MTFGRSNAQAFVVTPGVDSGADAKGYLATVYGSISSVSVSPISGLSGAIFQNDAIERILWSPSNSLIVFGMRRRSTDPDLQKSILGGIRFQNSGLTFSGSAAGSFSNFISGGVKYASWNWSYVGTDPWASGGLIQLN